MDMLSMPMEMRTPELPMQRAQIQARLSKLWSSRKAMQWRVLLRLEQAPRCLNSGFSSVFCNTDILTISTTLLTALGSWINGSNRHFSRKRRNAPTKNSRYICHDSRAVFRWVHRI